MFLLALSLNQASWSCAAWVKEENPSLLILLDFLYALMLMTPHNEVEPVWYNTFKDTIPLRLPTKNSLVFVLMQYQDAEPGLVHFALPINRPVEFNLTKLKRKVKAHIFYVTYAVNCQFGATF